MYNKDDKRKLYWLINQYLLSEIDESVFCNEFHDSFVNEMDISALTNIEYETFMTLSDISQRFSEDEEDFKLWSGFVTADKLRQKIIETKEKLRDNFDLLFG